MLKWTRGTHCDLKHFFVLLVSLFRVVVLSGDLKRKMEHVDDHPLHHGLEPGTLRQEEQRDYRCMGGWRAHTVSFLSCFVMP